MNRRCAFIVVIVLCYGVMAATHSTLTSFSNDNVAIIRTEDSYPTEGLVAHFPFNGNANDRAPNGQHGVVVNATLTQDRFGANDAAYDFNGVSSYIFFTNSNVRSLQNHTVAFWVKRLGDGTESPRLFLNGSVNSSITIHQNYLSDEVNYRIYPSSFFVTTTHALTSNTWVFIACAYDGTMQYIYRNGIAIASNMISMTIETPQGDLGYIGGDDLGSSFHGAIDDLRVYNRALTPDEIVTIYTGVTPAVHITSATASVNYDMTSYVIAGTSATEIVGGMWVTNAASSEVHAFPAARAWSAPAVQLLAGQNLIVVAGTNAAGTVHTDSIFITRQGLSSVTPVVAITNAPLALLNYHVASCALAGTNNSHVHGGMWWTNATTEATGPVTHSHPRWSCIATGLAEGTNIIHVCGSNYWNVTGVDSIMIVRGFEHDLPLLDALADVTLREHQVLRRNAHGRANVAQVVCLPGAVKGAWCFDSNTWQFSCVPDLGTAGQEWEIPFVGINAFGMETQILHVAVGAPVKGIGPKKPLLFEDEDGDLIDMKYSGLKKAGALLFFDGYHLVVSNAQAGGKLAVKLKANKETGNSSFTLRTISLDNSAKAITLAGNVESIEMPEHTVQSLKMSSTGGYLSNATLGAAGSISVSKGSIVGTVACSNGFGKLAVQELRGARILAGVLPGANVTNTPARASFGSIKAQLMAGSIIAGADTVENVKITEPKISVTHASSSWFFHTKFDGAIDITQIETKK